MKNRRKNTDNVFISKSDDRTIYSRVKAKNKKIGSVEREFGVLRRRDGTRTGRRQHARVQRSLKPEMTAERSTPAGSVGGNVRRY